MNLLWSLATFSTPAQVGKHWQISERIFPADNVFSQKKRKREEEKRKQFRSDECCLNVAPFGRTSGCPETSRSMAMLSRTVWSRDPRKRPAFFNTTLKKRCSPSNRINLLLFHLHTLRKKDNLKRSRGSNRKQETHTFELPTKKSCRLDEATDILRTMKTIEDLK